MNLRNIFLIIVLFFLISCSSPRIIISKSSGNIELKVEIAQTTEEHVQGLMNRKQLKENTGMFFIFEKEHALQFWMKNMSFPIDIIYLDKSLKIVDIKHNFRPCTQEPCPTYVPKQIAKYVLETNAGFAKQNNLKINETLLFKK